jgi:hypothetical protein
MGLDGGHDEGERPRREDGRMSGLAVVPVHTRQELRAFIGLPFRLYRHDRYWVAPSRRQQRRQLDRDRNPFFLDAEAAYFLARRDGRTVGRISAHIDHRYNRFHSNPAHRTPLGSGDSSSASRTPQPPRPCWTPPGRGWPSTAAPSC